MSELNNHKERPCIYCYYCHEDKEGYSATNGAFWIEHSAREGYLLHGGKCKPRPINYCFMCGRKLNRRSNDGT